MVFKHLLIDSRVLFDSKDALERAKRNCLAKLGYSVGDNFLEQIEKLGIDEKKKFDSHFEALYPTFFLSVMGRPYASSKEFLEFASQKIPTSAISFEYAKTYSALLKSNGLDVLLAFHFGEGEMSARKGLLEIAVEHLNVKKEDLVLISPSSCSFVRTIKFAGGDLSNLRKKVEKVLAQGRDNEVI